jgi:hypothetical protein
MGRGDRQLGPVAPAVGPGHILCFSFRFEPSRGRESGE